MGKKSHRDLQRAEMEARGMEYYDGAWRKRILTKEELWALRRPLLTEDEIQQWNNE